MTAPAPCFTRDNAAFRVRAPYLDDMHECRSQRGEIVLPDAEIVGYLADDLRTAARDSLALVHLRDPQTGRIPGDPLALAIPGDGDAHPLILDAVQLVTGNAAHRQPPRGIAARTAPASRAALRRWASAERKGESGRA